MPPPQTPSARNFGSGPLSDFGKGVGSELTPLQSEQAVKSMVASAKSLLQMIDQMNDSMGGMMGQLGSVAERLHSAIEGQIPATQELVGLASQLRDFWEDTQKRVAVMPEQVFRMNQAIAQFQQVTMAQNQMANGAVYGYGPGVVEVTSGLPPETITTGVSATFTPGAVPQPDEGSMQARFIQKAREFGGQVAGHAGVRGQIRVGQQGVGGLLGRFGLGRLGGFLPTAGVTGGVVAGVGLGYQAYETLTGVGQEYTQITGGTSIAEGLGFEGRARLASLRPGIGTEEARQAMQGILGAGYRGRESEMLFEFALNNIQEGTLDVAQSLQLYQTVAQGARGSTEQISASLDSLRTVAAETGGSLEGMVNIFSGLSTQATGAGLTGAAATGFGRTYAEALRSNSRLGEVANFGAPDFQNEIFTIQMAQRLGVRPGQVFGALSNMGSLEITKTTQDQLRGSLGRFTGIGYRPDMTPEEFAEFEHYGTVVGYLEQIGMVQPGASLQDPRLMAQVIQGQFTGGEGGKPLIDVMGAARRTSQEEISRGLSMAILGSLNEDSLGGFAPRARAAQGFAELLGMTKQDAFAALGGVQNVSRLMGITPEIGEQIASRALSGVDSSLVPIADTLSGAIRGERVTVDLTEDAKGLLKIIYGGADDPFDYQRVWSYLRGMANTNESNR